MHKYFKFLYVLVLPHRKSKYMLNYFSPSPLNDGGMLVFFLMLFSDIQRCIQHSVLYFPCNLMNAGSVVTSLTGHDNTVFTGCLC